MLGWVTFRAENLSETFTMGQVVNPSEYLGLGLRENYYVVAFLMTAAVVLTFLSREVVSPWLRRYRPASFALETICLAGIVGLVFVFLRPMRQFIYFQF